MTPERSSRPDLLYFDPGHHQNEPVLNVFLGTDTSRRKFKREHKIALVDNDRFKVAEARRKLYDPRVAKVVDFDGFFMNTEDIQQKANPLTAQALQERHNALLLPWQPHFKGQSDEQIFAAMLGDNLHLAPNAIQYRDQALIQLAGEVPDATSHLMPGMDHFVRLMRATHQRVGIASTSPDEYITILLGKITVDGIPVTDVFPPEAVVGSTSMRRLSHYSGHTSEALLKPNPLSVRLAGSLVEQQPNSSIFYMGDTQTDGQTIQRGKRHMQGLLIPSQTQRKSLSRHFSVIDSLYRLLPRNR